MSTPQPPLTPDQRLALEQKARYDKFTRNVAIGGVIICPIIAFMPPRKLDLYTFALGIGTYLSADHLSTSYTGRGLVDRIAFPRFDPVLELPTEKAKETQRKIREKEELERRRQALREGRESLGEKEENKSIFHRLWMGDEKEGWKERRMVEERRALEEGKTYTSIIMDQIWEVWNWDKKKDGEEESKKDEPKKP